MNSDLPIWTKAVRELGAKASRYTVLRVDNVADWVRPQIFPDPEAHGHNMEIDWLIKTFPNIAPVGDYMWFEFRPAIPYVNAASGLSVTSQCCVLTSKLLNPKAKDEELKWGFTSSVAGLSSAGELAMESRTVHIAVAANGKFLNFKCRDEREGLPAMDEETIVALASLAFLHCKNVTTQEHRPSRQVARALQRDSLPIVTHKTIIVAGGSRRQSDAGATGVPDRGVSLHIVRGHFALYTEDKPLFGRPGQVGAYYHPQHTRGSAQVGTVDHDYKVGPR